MSKTNTGGSAFPISGSEYRHTQGMTLRDYFAAKALQGVVGNPGLDMGREELAAWAYKMADTLLEAREA
jgi:hypothetical protein